MSGTRPTAARAAARPRRPLRGVVVAAAGVLALAGCASGPAGSAPPGASPAGAAGPGMPGHVHAGTDMPGMGMPGMDVPATDAGRPAAGGAHAGAAGDPGSGTVRSYYVSADEVLWDYAPTGRDEITGAPFDETAAPYVLPGEGRIGAKYLKCLYRGYTDAGFGTLQARSPQDAHLGFLGPVLRAEVGDTIRVVFRNTCPFPTSMHPHGVFYTKADEGAPYADGDPSGEAPGGDAVPTGGTWTYTWQVPGRAGPGPGDGSSVMWMYHSHTEEIGDVYAGLVGPLVVTRHGSARPDGSPRDVDREVFLDFTVDDENQSPLLAANQARAGVPVTPPEKQGEEIAESNLKHTINGYLYGGMPVVDLRVGQHVRWYAMSMGTEVDLHSPHWHGNDVLVNGMRMDVVSLLPAQMVTADMVPDDPGTWLVHCHVADHIRAGMSARYRVGH